MKINILLSIAILLGSGVCIARSKSDEARANPFNNVDIVTNKTDCDAEKYTVWVRHDYQDVCVRYYPSSDLANAEKVIVFFNGDIPSDNRWHNRAWKKSMTPSIIASQKRWEDRTGYPVVMIGRVGMIGSSGDPSDKRSRHAFQTMLIALELLRAKFQIKEVALVGQSGGANTVAALFSMNAHASCVVGSSGGYNLRKRYRDVYSPFDRAGIVPVTSGQRIFITASPSDRKVSYPSQIEYARLLQHGGHDVVALTVHGMGEDGHGTSYIGKTIASLCLRGESREAIINKALEESERTADRAGKRAPDKATHTVDALSCNTPYCVEALGKLEADPD